MEPTLIEIRHVSAVVGGEIEGMIQGHNDHLRVFTLRW
jgi:hypothetical protein